MPRWQSLPWLALCGVAQAVAQPHIDLTATTAWNGWTRPGRATEVNVRLVTDVATPATLDIAAGSQVVHASLELEPGRVVRVHVPIESVEDVTVSVGSPAMAPQRRTLRIAQSESPLLGVGVVGDDPVNLEGFHALTLAADELPRNASAYASIDALILDGPTLSALDQRQLGALLAHAAQCGRIVLLNAERPVQRMLDRLGGCGGRAVMSATSLADATRLLGSSLTTSTPSAIPLVSVRALAQPGRATWNRVLVLLAAYFAVAVLTLVLLPSLRVLLVVPALATMGILVLLPVLEPSPPLIVWSEGESGAQVARYQAWQLYAGGYRGHTRVPVLAQLDSPRSCEPMQPLRFDFDSNGGHLASADFDTRLFRVVPLCYSGMSPLTSAIDIEARTDTSLAVRNAGGTAWPSGVLLVGGAVHDLPVIGPGASTVIRAGDGNLPGDAATQLAMSRTARDGAAALWEFERDNGAEAMTRSKRWLLLSAPRR